MSTGNRVVMNPAEVQAFIRSPAGPVLRTLTKDGDAVKAIAKRRVGVYKPPDAYSAANRRRRPGTLRDSIVKRVVTGGTYGFTVEVGSNDPIALIHHEGTVPHVIRARNAPLLVFFWPKAGGVVRFKSVNHPGTKPNRFLTDAVREYYASNRSRRISDVA